jgi:hypothetical protein
MSRSNADTAARNGTRRYACVGLHVKCEVIVDGDRGIVERFGA